MRNTENTKGISLELFIVEACQAALLLIILFIPASAQVQKEKSSQLEANPVSKIQVCLARPADAVMTAQKNADGFYSGRVLSTGTIYNNDANDCEYFIVDLILPEGFKIRAQHVVSKISISGGFSDTTGITENNCPQASFRMITYKSYANSTEKSRVYDSNIQGVWVSGSGFTLCDFFRGDQKPLQVDIPVGGVGIRTTYRVLVLPKLNGQVRRAKMEWSVVYAPS